METSARNQLPGRIARVTLGAVNAEVELELEGGVALVAIVTNASAERLGLAEGGRAWALVKASSVILAPADEVGRTSARNRLCGRVSASREGAVNGEVSLTLDGGGEITAIVTNESLRRLGLHQGVSACALIKASSIILAVD